MRIILADYFRIAMDVVVALGTLATVLAHLPFMPPGAAALFARFGVATGKFAVVTKE
jgi:hypothetical protein